MEKMVWTEEMEKLAKLVPVDQLAHRVFKEDKGLKAIKVTEVKTDNKDQQDQEARLDHRVFKVWQVRMVKTET